jgi:hypothetical protein
LSDITSDFTVGLYSSSGFYINAKRVIINDSVFKKGNYPVSSLGKAPNCKTWKVDAPEQLPDTMKGVEFTEFFEPMKIYEYPKNNSCPFINDFLSHPGLPKFAS